jgi:hypothetical protein
MFKKLFAILLTLMMLCSCQIEEPSEPVLPEEPVISETEMETEAEEIDFDGLDITSEVKEELFDVDKERWSAEIEEIQAFYDKLDYVPEALAHEFEALKKRVRG